MSKRSSAEVRDVLQEVQQPFRDLYSVAQERADLVYARHSKRLDQALAAAHYTVRVPVASRMLGRYIDNIVADQRRTLEIHVEPGRDGDKGSADKLEVVLAHGGFGPTLATSPAIRSFGRPQFTPSMPAG